MATQEVIGLRELERLIGQAMRHMTPRVRECFYLRQIKGMSKAKVASLTGRSGHTIRNNMVIARRQLRTFINKQRA